MIFLCGTLFPRIHCEVQSCLLRAGVIDVHHCPMIHCADQSRLLRAGVIDVHLQAQLAFLVFKKLEEESFLKGHLEV